METINALGDLPGDVQRAEDALCAAKERLEAETEAAEERLRAIAAGEHLLREMESREVRSETMEALIRSAGLSKRNADILVLAKDGVPFTEIAARYNLTRDRIRQIVTGRIYRIVGAASAYNDERQELLGKVEQYSGMVSTLAERCGMLEEDNRTIRRAFGCPERGDGSAEPLGEREREVLGILRTPLHDCDFSVRTLNCLHSIGVETIGDILKHTKMDLLRVRNFGRRSLMEIENFLDSCGIDFGTDVRGLEYREAQERIDAAREIQ